MNQPSLQLLNKLLNAWQSNPDHTRKVRLPISETRAPQYFAAILPDAKESLHAGLLEAESSGAVTLEWGRGYEKHILKRITLEDGPGLAHYLGIPLAAKQADDARMILERELSGREPWINEWVQEVLKRWSRNQSAGGLSSGDIAQARLLVRALEAVAAGRHRNLDLRTFSIRELGSSKALETILARFASIWKMYHPADLTNDELMETLGLVKFPHPLLIRGPVTLNLTDRLIDCSGIQPFVGLPPQAVRGVCTEKMPEFVLTIENLASFNRYTAEIQDNGLILYSAGFPAPGIADFLRMLDITLPKDINFLHWGDIDEGGLKIFIYIQSLLKRTLKPHLMTPNLLALYGQPNHNLRIEEVRRTADKNLAVVTILEAMISTKPPKTLEQENVDPFGVSA